MKPLLCAFVFLLLCCIVISEVFLWLVINLSWIISLNNIVNAVLPLLITQNSRCNWTSNFWLPKRSCIFHFRPMKLMLKMQMVPVPEIRYVCIFLMLFSSNLQNMEHRLNSCYCTNFLKNAMGALLSAMTDICLTCVIYMIPGIPYKRDLISQWDLTW